MSFLKGMFGASAAVAPQQRMLPPGWIRIMDGDTPKYFHAGMGRLQTEFPQPEREPEPERELPAGWEKRDFREYVEYVNTLDPHASSERSFPTEPAQRPLSPYCEEIKVENIIMYRPISNKNFVTAVFQPASDDQIAIAGLRVVIIFSLMRCVEASASKANASKANASKASASKANASKARNHIKMICIISQSFNYCLNFSRLMSSSL